ncbi:head-tail connector protein [Acetobacterium sp.]|uniref:head-tail connector protein n=1 Tax=Acetobacterium sp. TaxID=1872094 RepID=UPI00271E855E|nr:head-tail connector protein [Acetobacterium sp.]MDO9490801.1 head-tail connector protein [Acetobacterium sp.]
MITVEEAREYLRLDGTDNDGIISPLLDAIPGYIELTTGMTAAQQASEPLAKTASKFLLLLWYNPEQADVEKIQRVIDNLLKGLSALATVSN